MNHRGNANTRRIFLCATLVVAAVLALSASRAPARAQSEAQPLRVVIKPLTPFVTFEAEKQTGFSIDLWTALALQLGRPYEYVRVESVKQQLEAVEGGAADVAITGISITSDRETRIDFSQPYFDAGLQIMTRVDEGVGLGNVISQLFSPALLQVIVLMAVTVFITANLIWLIERRTNSEDFPRPYLRGLWESFWWAITTLSSGSGEVNPKSVLGRLVAVIWMFAAIFLIAHFTAVMTSNLTLQNLQGTINSVADLPGKSVVTVEGSTSSRFLSERGIAHQRVETIEQAYPLLEGGQVQAIVYDAPVLRYYATQDEHDKVKLVGAVFNVEKYGIALPNGSPLREEINRALLRAFEDGTYDEIYARWFGETP
jgi:polar amino acid transport system substrate-binding protein